MVLGGLLAWYPVLLPESAGTVAEAHEYLTRGYSPICWPHYKTSLGALFSRNLLTLARWTVEYRFDDWTTKERRFSVELCDDLAELAKARNFDVLFAIKHGESRDGVSRYMESHATA